MKTVLNHISLKKFLFILAPLAGAGAVWLICAGKWYLLTYDLQGSFVPQYLCNLLPLLTSLKEQLLSWQSQPLVGSLLEDTSYLAVLSRGVWAVKIFYGFLCLVVLLEGVYFFLYLLCRMGGYRFSCRKLGIFNGGLVFCVGIVFLLFAHESLTMLEDAFSSLNAVAQWFGASIHAEDLVRLTKTPVVVCALGVVQVGSSVFQAEPYQFYTETSRQTSDSSSL